MALAAEVFRRYDADGSGGLDRDELLSALRELGLLGGKVSASAAGRVLAEMDANGDGRVSFLVGTGWQLAAGWLALLPAGPASGVGTCSC